jgi:DNA end-binding protein Ku
MPRAKRRTQAVTEHRRAETKPSGRLGHGRPAWQGHLKLSLVSCPVVLVSAIAHTADITFHLINPKTHNRIKMVPTDPDTGPVERADLVKGYEISKNEYVLVSDEELEDVRLETTRTIDIERFVDVASIDRMFWNAPYFLLPNGKEALEAYVVIREAMEKIGRIALGRVVMHTRERLLAIEPRDRGMLAYTLHTRDEVVDPALAFRDIPAQKPDKSMVEIAEKIIAQQEGPFEPEDFKDRYENALKELIRSKERGEKPVSAPPPPDNVINLMDALKKSLKSRPRPQAAHAKRTPRKRER